ncbi:hypothetical protein D3C85_1299610 [compost metagenome]
MAGECVICFGQGFEHPLTTGNVGRVDVCSDGVNPERIKRMALRRHQIPASIAFLGAEKATGLEGRAFGQTTELVQGGLLALGQPGFQLLLLLAGGAFQLFVTADFFRPFVSGRLAVGIHQPAIHGLGYRLTALHTKALQQDALRGFGLVHRQAHRHHPAAIQLTGAAGQQHSLPLNGHRHRRASLHALAQR